VTEVTYLGVVHGTLAALRRMRARDAGVIVQVGSALAYRAIPLQSAYCASKHAIEGFTESLRCELLHDGSNIRVTMVQLPAINTPQFDWLRNRLPRRAQPVPPIFQPELAARAIRYAALQPRRELVVGGSTLLAMLADKLAPGIADRYLASTGFESQQDGVPEDRDRPDNLYQPVPGLHATHGRFDHQASDSSTQFWLNTHRPQVAAVLATAAALILVARHR
jgi:short-subunit dehydrogenase